MDKSNLVLGMAIIKREIEVVHADVLVYGIPSTTPLMSKHFP